MEDFTTPEIEQPLSATELAPIIGLHSVTILRWAREGRIPHHRLSARKIVFLPSEINRWLSGDSGLYPVRVGHAA
jgi:excisionase family DNA binding protein